MYSVCWKPGEAGGDDQWVVTCGRWEHCVTHTPASPMSGSRSELTGHSIINKPVPAAQWAGPPGWSAQLWVTQVTSPGHHSGPHPPPDLSPPPPTVFISNQLRLPRLHKGFYQHPPSGVAVMNPLVVQVTIFKKFRKTKSLLPTCPILFLFVD